MIAVSRIEFSHVLKSFFSHQMCVFLREVNERVRFTNKFQSCDRTNIHTRPMKIFESLSSSNYVWSKWCQILRTETAFSVPHRCFILTRRPVGAKTLTIFFYVLLIACFRVVKSLYDVLEALPLALLFGRILHECSASRPPLAYRSSAMRTNSMVEKHGSAVETHGSAIQTPLEILKFGRNTWIGRRNTPVFSKKTKK